MSLQNRFGAIISEQGLKQKELATALKISESYISNILNGKRTVLSTALAALIEEIYGYSASWVLTGEPPKYARAERSGSAAVRNRIIEDIKSMDDAELSAVLAFMRSLASVKDSLKDR